MWPPSSIAARAELGRDVPLVTVFMNREGPPPALREAGIPSFVFPENAARALGRSIAWEDRRGRPAGRVLRPDVDAHRDWSGSWPRPVAARATAGWPRPTPRRCSTRTASRWPAPCRVRTPGEAEAAQAELGCTVVVKVAAAIHKSDVGGVRLGVTTPAAAADAVRAIRADLESAGLAGAGHRVPRAGADRVGTGDDRGCQPRPLARAARRWSVWAARWSRCWGTSLSGSHRSPTTTSRTCCSR